MNEININPQFYRLVPSWMDNAGRFSAPQKRHRLIFAWDVIHLSEPSAAILKTPEFRARFIALSAAFEQPLQTYTYARLRSLLRDRFITEQLTPSLLPENTTINAEDLAEKSWSQVESLLSLQSHEKEYIDAIQRGELRLDLLFHNNEKEIALLGQHPAILWKLENVRMHRLAPILFT